jgi:hypothetical protein
MTPDPGLESTRRFALGEVKRVLGLTEAGTDRLFAKAKTALGPDRTAQCLDLARQARLTDRWIPVSAVAALIAGTHVLGPEWWTRVHEELDDSLAWLPRGIPDKLLTAGHGDKATEEGGSSLDLLARWIADDAADKDWGRPVDRVDVNDPRVDGRVGVPKGASAGDRVTAIFATGGRIWVDIVDRNAEPAEGGAAGAPQVSAPKPGAAPRLGTRLAERRFHDVAQVRSAWSLATSAAPIRLPGETAGRATDPYAVKLEADISRRLFDWAKGQGATAQQLAGPWRTVDGLWSARLRLGVIYGLPGSWVAFDDAVIAAVDDDRPALQEAISALGI